MAKWMTVDPGINGTGFACFINTELIEWGNFTSSAATWERRAHVIVRKLSWKEYQGSEKTFCEWPSNFTGSAKGLAALNSGSILKLAFLIGKISERLENVNLISVQKWKGQLPKEVTKQRAEKFFKKTGFKSHAADAVGIGQYVIQKGLL